MLPTGRGNGVRVRLLSRAGRIPALASLCTQTRETMGDEADLEIGSIDTQAHGSESLRVKHKYACIAQEDELASSS
jgi:hypothetical protein